MKKTITNPFLGKIELTRVGETSLHGFGEARVDTIYSDDRGNYYIDTWTTIGGDPQPMIYLRKELIDKIVEINTKSNEV